jgi:hypothetical protein
LSDLIEILEVEIFPGDLFFCLQLGQAPNYDSRRDVFCIEAQPGFKTLLNGGRRMTHTLSKLFTPNLSLFLIISEGLAWHVSFFGMATY